MLLILPFLLTTCLCFAQEETEHQEQLSENELKINMFEILVMPAVGITYERFITNNSSWGAYGFVNFNSDEIYRSEKFELAPFYRIYFQKRKPSTIRGFIPRFLPVSISGKLNFTMMVLIITLLEIWSVKNI